MRLGGWFAELEVATIGELRVAFFRRTNEMNNVCAALIVSCFVLAVHPVSCADEMPDSILRYFPGRWRIEGPDGSSGTVEWKLVAGGKAVAGAGTSTDGGADFGLAGWKAKEKKWVHTVFSEDGGYIYLEITRFENGNTYLGTQRVVDANGTAVESKFTNRVVDPRHFEVTLDDGKQKTVRRWTRLTATPD